MKITYFFQLDSIKDLKKLVNDERKAADDVKKM